VGRDLLAALGAEAGGIERSGREVALVVLGEPALKTSPVPAGMK
jgi:hypothetical protein